MRLFPLLASAQPPDNMVSPHTGWGLLIGFAIVVISGTASTTAHLPDIRVEGAWFASGVFLLTLLVVYLRSTTAAVLTCGLAASAMETLLPGNTAYAAVITSIVFAGLRLDRSTGRYVALVTVLAFVCASLLGPEHLPPSQIASMTPGILFAYLAAASIRSLRVEQRRTQSLLREVVAGRDAVIHAAALEERTRLAREIHDVLAHTLSALSIQLEGLGMLAAQQPDSPSVAPGLLRAGRLAQEGLIEARRAVTSLREEGMNGSQALSRLAADFEADTGISCGLFIDSGLERFPTEPGLAIYRTTQEALTNVRKHSSSSRVEIRLCQSAEAIELTVENTGQLKRSPVDSGGFGLTGMRERAELLGGRLEAGPTSRGFLVRLWIPL